MRRCGVGGLQRGSVSVPREEEPHGGHEGGADDGHGRNLEEDKKRHPWQGGPEDLMDPDRQGPV
jgi:hypothetical protein